MRNEKEKLCVTCQGTLRQVSYKKRMEPMIVTRQGTKNLQEPFKNKCERGVKEPLLLFLSGLLITFISFPT